MMLPDDDILQGGRHRIDYFRYHFAQEELHAYAVFIAHDLGYDSYRALSRAELMEIALAADASDLSREKLRWFRRMDLALEVADESGDIRYFAVEVAFYAEQEGIDRALTRSRMLARFTGRPAYAVVAVGRDYRGLSQDILNGEYPILLDTVDSEQVYLYQLNERNLERAMADRRYERRLDGY